MDIIEGMRGLICIEKVGWVQEGYCKETFQKFQSEQ